jgi:uncharacterized protein (DUF1697 family)
MDRYVAFLRGINLGGRRIKNEELRRHFEEIGLEEVATFRASGNVIEEVAAIAAREPFDPKAVAKSKGKPQVLFLTKKPNAAAKKKALALVTEEDLLAIEGRELHWLPSGGISESGLDLKALDAALGSGTIRTMGTVEQIAAKYG